MPSSIIAAVELIGYEVASVTLVAYSVEIGTTLYYTALVAASVTYGNSRKRAAARAARDAYNASLEDRLVMATTVDGPRTRIYGRVRNVDGVIFKASHGVNLETYTLVVSLCGHEVDAIETVYLNDRPVSLDTNGWVTTAEWGKRTGDARTHVVNDVTGAFAINLPDGPSGPPVLDGSVSAVWSYGTGQDQYSETITVTVNGTLVSGVAPSSPLGQLVITYDDGTVEPRVRIRRYTGAPGQDLSAELIADFPGLVTSADKFSIGALLLVDLTYDPDIFTTGIPNFSAVMRGARILDRRTGLTGWTRNPALIADDWAQYKFGGTLTADVLDDQQVKDAANACDVSTDFVDDNNVVTTDALYVCDMVASLNGQTGADRVMDDIVTTMAGRWGWSGGILNLRAGIYRAPVITIDEDWIAEGEGMAIVPEPGSDDAVNVMRTRIADAAQDYVAVSAPPIRVSAWIASDGRELPQEITLTGITDAVHAGHVQAVMLRERRNGLTLKASLNLRGLQLKLFTVVWVNLSRFGMSLKQFEVLSWGFGLTGGVDVMLKETAASIYTPDAVFPAIDATPNTALPDPRIVPQVANLSAVSGTAQLLRLADGSIAPRVLVSWAPITDAAVISGGQIEVQFKRASAGSAAPWEAVLTAGGAAQVYVTGVAEADVITVRARAANSLVFGTWSAHVAHQVIGKSQPASDPTGFGGSVVNGRITWIWDANIDLDYGSSSVRLGGTSWDTATPAFTGSANTWQQDVTAEGNYTAWLKHVDTSGNLSTAAATYTVAVTAGDLASGGANGLSNAPVHIYQRSASGAPALPSATVTYTFAGGLLTGLNNGWTAGVPAGADPLYLSVATASSSSPSDTIASGEWASAVVLAQDGTPGSAGINSATVYLFQRTSSATAPPVPSTTTTWTFATGVATGMNNGWSQSLPSSGGAWRWVTTASALSTGPTDTITSGEWAAVALLAEDGAAGADGLHNALAHIYQRSASGAPALPSATVTYTFAGGVLTGLNNGWTSTIPAGSDPIYVSVATASSSSPSDTIASGEWAGAVVLAQDGAPGSAGAAGINSATVYLLQRTSSATAPPVPSTTTTWTFATGVATGMNNGWSQSLPSSGGAWRWVTTASALSTGPTDTITSGEWAAVALLAEDGAAGAAGAAGADGASPFNLVLSTQMHYAGGRLYRAGGTAGWTEGAYSIESYAEAAFLSFKAEQLNRAMMIGFNVDPSLNNDFSSIDHAWYIESNGESQVYENGNPVNTSVARSLADVFSILSDGKTVRYFVNGQLRYTSPLSPVGKRFFMDSSFHSSDGAVNSLAFGASGSQGADAVSAALSSYQFNLPAYADGVVQSFTNATTTMSVKNGIADDTANWTFSRVVSDSGISVSASGVPSGRTVSVTAMASTLDVGYVDITATRSGYPTQTLRWVLGKNKSTAPSAGVSAVVGDYYVTGVRVTPSGSQTVTAKLTFRSDGTIWKAYTISGGSVTSVKVGDWYKPNTSGIGSQYKIAYTLVVTKDENAGGVVVAPTVAGWSNDAAIATDISVDRAAQLSLTNALAYGYAANGYYTLTDNADNPVGGGNFTLTITRDF